MVKRLFSSFGKEVVNLHDAAYLLGIFAILSQILGLFRDRFLAHYFGAGAILDVYYASFRVPDLIFVSISSLVSMSVLIPYFQEKIAVGKDEAKEFIDQIFSSFSIIIIFVSLIAFALMPTLISKIFSQLPLSSQSDIIDLSRILLLSPIFMGVSNLLACITQSYKRFILYATAPIVYNISIILGLAILYPTLGIKGVAIGVAFGALMHASIQLPFVKSMGLIPDFVFPIKWKSISNVVKISLPRTFTLSISSIAVIALVAIASRLTEGSISIFNLSYNLESVPLTVIGISYSMAAFPVLSKYFIAGEKNKFINQVASASKHIIFFSLPMSALFIVLRAQVVRTVLGSGQFSWSDTKLTAACLALFSISVVFQSLSLLFVRAFYASGMTKIPLYISTASSVVMVATAFLFLKIFSLFPWFLQFIENLFRVSNVSGTEVLAIPLALSLGASLNALFLWIWFEKKVGMITLALRKTIQDSLFSSILCGFAAYLSLQVLENFLDLNTLAGIATQGLIAGIVGIVVWIASLAILKSKELEEVWGHISTKVFKAKPIPAELTDL